MYRPFYLLLALIALFFALSYLNIATYGPSYGFLDGEDCWVPDDQGGWVKHGSPVEPAPIEPSMKVPLAVRYVPILVPGLLLALFLFTPLRRKLERPPTTEEVEADESEQAENRE